MGGSHGGTQCLKPAALFKQCPCLTDKPHDVQVRHFLFVSAFCSSSWPGLQQDLRAHHWHHALLIFGPHLCSNLEGGGSGKKSWIVLVRHNFFVSTKFFWGQTILEHESAGAFYRREWHGKISSLGKSASNKTCAPLEVFVIGADTGLCFRWLCRILWKASQQSCLWSWTSTTPPEQAFALEMIKNGSSVDASKSWVVLHLTGSPDSPQSLHVWGSLDFQRTMEEGLTSFWNCCNYLRSFNLSTMTYSDFL